MKSISSLSTLSITLATACTTLGPMPATTGVSAVPAGRPGAEAQVGAMPGHYLSAGTTEAPKGGATGQATVLVEPDRWIHVPGLIVGGRVFGQSKDSPVEPMVGYRRAFNEDVAIAVVGFGTATSATKNEASYKATRLGAEVAVDAKVIPITPWLALHAQGAAAVTYLSATGTYCVDATGVGVDCDSSTGAQNTFVDAKVSDAFPSATGTLALDAGHLRDGWFHSARLAVLGAAGMMPTLTNGMQQSSRGFASIGLSLTLGVGE